MRHTFWLTLLLIGSAATVCRGQAFRAPHEGDNRAGIPSAKVALVVNSRAISVAVEKAFAMAGNGTLGKETGFAAVKNADGSYSPTKVFIGEWGQVAILAPRGAVAIFHTHRNGVNPRPSMQDIKEADKYQLTFFVISNSGLWAYEPDPNKKGKGRVYQVAGGSNWPKEYQGAK